MENSEFKMHLIEALKDRKVLVTIAGIIEDEMDKYDFVSESNVTDVVESSVRGEIDCQDLIRREDVEAAVEDCLSNSDFVTEDQLQEALDNLSVKSQIVR